MYLKYILLLLILKLSTQYRLPPDCVEVYSYTIEITITNHTLHGTHIFQGTTTIEFATTNTTKEIQLHFGRHMFLSGLQLTQRGVDVELKTQNVDSFSEFLTIQTKKEVKGGVTCELRIDYDAEFYTDRYNGFYQSHYTDEDGKERIMGSTKLEPFYAHNVFPCFDEPQYKAYFHITIKHPKDYKVVSNNRRIEDVEQSDPLLETSRFVATPIMPTYLVAFVISNFSCDQNNDVEAEIIYSVCSRPGTEHMRQLAMDWSPKVLKFLEDFTEIGYNNVTGIHKIDQYAIPQTDSGAMENWGLVTYSEAYLLWDPEDHPNLKKDQVKKGIAHELSHFWFGNLVTIDWWSNLFLVEGFVSYMSYYVANEIDPSLEFDKRLVVYDLHTILHRDSFRTTLPLNAPVPTPQNLFDKFGGVTYLKGACIFRMVHLVIGDDIFKSGLRHYLDKHQYGNVNPDDLWEVFEDYDNLDLLMENWITQPGYPVVTARADGLKIKLTQERFVLEVGEVLEEPAVHYWHIPISYTISADSDKFNDTSAEFWMPPQESFELDLNEEFEWIIFNNQQTGFYRVNYDDHLWSKIVDALNSKDFEEIHELNRAQLVDDVYAFSKAYLKNVTEVLHFYEFLEKDTSYYSWYPAFQALAEMLERTANDELRSTFLKYIRDLMTTAYKTVSFQELNEDDQMYALKREMMITRACEFGFQDCIDNCVEAFETYKKTKIQPDKNLREVIFCYGLRHSKDLKSDWDVMWDEMRVEKNQDHKNLIKRILGCPKDKDILRSYIHKIFDANEFKKWDQAYVLATVFNNKPEGVDVVLDFITDNHDLDDFSSYLAGFYSRFTTRGQYERFEEFLNTTELDHVTKMVLTLGLKEANRTLNSIEYFERDLNSYFVIRSKKKSLGADFTTGVAILLPLIMMCILFY